MGDANLRKEDDLKIVAVACHRTSKRVSAGVLVLVMWHFLMEL